MTNQQKDNLTNEFESELKEMAHWFGGYNELRKIISKLEDNENEAAFERSQNEPGAWEGGFAENH